MAALRLEPDAGTDQLVDSGSAADRRPRTSSSKFGDDAVVVLVKGDLDQLVLTSDLGKLLSLEGCLSGNVEGGKVFTDRPAPAPCAALAASQPAQAVLGGATFLNQSAIQATNVLQGQSKAAVKQARAAATVALERARRQGLSTEQQQAAANAAAQEVLTQFRQRLLQLAVQYGQTGLPRLDDPTFVSAVVFDPARPGEPKPRFSIFCRAPTPRRSSIRLQPDLSESERSEAIGQFRDAVGDPTPSRSAAPSYVVSGAPVVVDGLADRSSPAQICILLGGGAGGHGDHPRARIPRRPLRLLPLAVALVAAGDHLRPAGAVRRLADDGLDRGPADPDRARGRLRDPVPGPLQRGDASRAHRPPAPRSRRPPGAGR